MFDPYVAELVPMFPTAGKDYLGNRDPDYLGNLREDGSGRIPLLGDGDDPLQLAIDCCQTETRVKCPPNSDDPESMSEFARNNTISGGIDFFVTFRVNDAQNVEEVSDRDSWPFNSTRYADLPDT
jgi:hypothetical protein